MTETISHKSQTKRKKSSNLKNYLLSFDQQNEEMEEETVIEYLEEWNKASIASKYQSLPSSKKKYIIRDIIFQRLAVALSLITVDDLQSCVDAYTEIKEEQEITLYDFFIEREILSEEVIHSLLCFQNPFDGSNLIPEYKIIDFIGEGGMGAVFLGQSLKNNERVAIKIFAPPVSDVSTEIARFKRECKVAMKLESPYIVKSHTSGDFYGMYYLVMEYIDGIPLDAKIKKRGRLYIEESLEIFEQLLIGMWEAWNRNFVHRDIKPANILVKEDGTVKICDLGLAKAIDCDEKITETGGVFGTPHYIAPERFLGEPADYRTDVYALGITLYEMLTGHTPFTGANYVDICQGHLYDIPTFAEHVGIKIPNYVISFVLQLLSKTPSDRCKNPTQLLENFKLIKNGKKPKGAVSYYRERRIKKIKKAFVISSIAFAVMISIVYFYYKDMQNTKTRMLIKQQEREMKNKFELEKNKNKLAREKMIEEQKELEKKRLLDEHKLQLEQQQQREGILKQKQLFEQQRKKDLVTKIKKDLEKLDFTRSHLQIEELQQNFPGCEEVNQLKLLIQKLTIMMSFCNQGEKKKAQEYISPLHEELGSITMAAIMAKILQVAAIENKAIVLSIWLELPLKTHNNITKVLRAENNIDWLRHAFVAMSFERAKNFYPLYLKINQKDAHQLKMVHTALFYLANIKTKSFYLDKMLSETKDSQFMTKVFHYALLEDKKNVIKNLPFILTKLQAENTSQVVKQLYTNTNEKIVILLLKRLKKYKSKITATILFDIAKSHQNKHIQTIALQTLVFHKQYNYLQQNIIKTTEEKQLKIIELLKKYKDKKSENVLLKALLSSFPSVREKSIFVLAMFNSNNSIKKLQVILLNDEYLSVRKKAAKALGKLSGSQALISLIQALEINDDFIIGRAILENISHKKNTIAARAIIEIILERPEYRRYAYDEVTIFPPQIMIPVITDLLNDVGPSDVRLMVNVLEKMGKASTPHLIKILETTDQFYTQKSIIKTLGNLRDPESITILLNMLHNNRAKRYAVTALEQIITILPDNSNTKIKIMEELNK